MILSITIVMVAPKGNKLFDSTMNMFEKKEETIQFQLTKYKAFLKEEETNFNTVRINKFGLVKTDSVSNEYE
jgi:hypothetical protein